MLAREVSGNNVMPTVVAGEHQIETGSMIAAVNQEVCIGDDHSVRKMRIRMDQGNIIALMLRRHKNSFTRPSRASLSTPPGVPVGRDRPSSQSLAAASAHIKNEGPITATK